jgi:hypothetical protein
MQFSHRLFFLFLLPNYTNKVAHSHFVDSPAVIIMLHVRLLDIDLDDDEEMLLVVPEASSEGLLDDDDLVPAATSKGLLDDDDLVPAATSKGLLDDDDDDEEVCP